MDVAVLFLSHPKLFVKYSTHGEPFSVTACKSIQKVLPMVLLFIIVVVAVVILITTGSVPHNT